MRQFSILRKARSVPDVLLGGQVRHFAVDGHASEDRGSAVDAEFAALDDEGDWETAFDEFLLTCVLDVFRCFHNICVLKCLSLCGANVCANNQSIADNPRQQ